MCDEAGLFFFQEAGRRHQLQLPELLGTVLSDHFLLSRDEPWEAQVVLVGVAAQSTQGFTCTQMLQWFVMCDLCVTSKSATSSKCGVA